MLIGCQEIEGFAAQMQGEERSAATVEKYCREAARFIEWLAGREVNQALALEYKAQLAGRVQAQGNKAAAADFPGRGAGADGEGVPPPAGGGAAEGQ